MSCKSKNSNFQNRHERLPRFELVVAIDKLINYADIYILYLRIGIRALSNSHFQVLKTFCYKSYRLKFNFRLPLDPKFMCNIGNGHLATDIFSNTVYMNGFYNGNKGESHRARIPAWCNVRLNSTFGDTGLKPSYTLDTSSGVFQVHVDREWSVVDQRIYAHRYYTRAIINQILISAKHKAGKLELHKFGR